MMGTLFIFSAPSGCGKTTILLQVQRVLDNLKFSVSSTTRPPRPREIHGKDYFFISEGEFLRKVQQNEFLEWAKVHDHYYGTEKKQIEDYLKAGQDVILDIDVQGARQVKCVLPRAVTIFILPPSWEELEKRLKLRATEPPETVRKRLKNALMEVSESYWYDFVIINDDLKSAVENVLSIIKAFRCSTYRHLYHIRNLLNSIK